MREFRGIKDMREIKELQDLIKSLEKTPDESAKAILHCKSILTEKLTKMREKKLRLILKKS